MSYQSIRVEHEGAIAIITLARPERLNALSIQLLQELIHALDDISNESAYRALLIQAEGRGFCSGADLTAFPLPPPQGLQHSRNDSGAGIEQLFNPLILRLFELPIPVICAVNGVAAGAGCSLALAADFVIASQDAYFIQSFVNIGLIPDAGATWMLTRAVGRARAIELMMLGEKLNADIAKDWGLIYQVAAPETLHHDAKALAERLSRGPTKAYGLIRKAARSALETSFVETLALERQNQRIAGGTQDYSECKLAFKEKRRPRFTGA